MELKKKFRVRLMTVGHAFGNLENLIRWNGPMRWIHLINVAMHTYGFREDGKLPPKTKTFQPGTEVVIRRFLCVGTHPAQAYGRAMAKLGQVGKVSLTISDPDGNAISTARVDLSRDGKAEKFIPAYPDENGLIELSLPAWGMEIKYKGQWKRES